MRLRTERGQAGAETAGVLLLVALIVGGFASTGLPATVADATGDAVCTIAGEDCEAPAPAWASGTSDDDDEQPTGPALEERPLVVLPFPGAVTVRCTVAVQPGGIEDPIACMPPDQPGVSVQMSGEVRIRRTPTALDAEGCPQQTLSVRGSLEVSTNGQVGGPFAGGELAGIVGRASEYSVTVSPEAAEAIEHGDRPPPNPVDPTTLAVGESVVLSEETYLGLGMEAQYNLLSSTAGFEQGTRISSGVQRVSPTTVRVMVGDEEFVRQAASLGVGVEGMRLSLGGLPQISTGRLYAVDIDISTPEGWAAYQAFITSGQLPTAGTPGTSDPTTAQTLDMTDPMDIGVDLGSTQLALPLQDAEGHRTITQNADGTVDIVNESRLNEVGVSAQYRENGDGELIGEPEYSLTLEGADQSQLEGIQQLDGDAPSEPPGGHVRIDFTAADLFTLRDLALEQLADSSEPPITAEQIAAGYAGNGDSDEFEVDGYVYSFDGPYDDLAQAETPEEILVALGGMGGSGANASDVLLGLELLLRDQGATLPGNLVTPECG